MQEPPLYRQSFGFSCGPAALMMVMKNLRKDLILDQDLELEIWRDATLMESKATSSFGLALAARRRGFRVTVRTDSGKIGFTSRLKSHFPRINTDFMEMLFDHTRRTALKEGVKWDREKVELNDVLGILDEGGFPIVLISSKMMREIVGIPHWVVVVGYDEKFYYINNPETARRERYRIKRFGKYLGFTGYRCMMVIS
jgi:hypothetical protein